MKRQFEKTTQYLAALMLGVLLTLGSVAQAADNIGVGDVAGDPAALVDSNTFVLNSSGALTLVKTAWLTVGGTPIVSGTTLPAGTQVDFMIYVNNKSDLQIDDVTIADTLDALFLYGPADNIRVDNAVVECSLAACDPAEELAIYNAARVVGAGTDAVGGDSVSYVAPTVDVGNENQGGNTQQNAAANSVLAVVFTVAVQ
jgi:hypothetical protein